MTTVSIALATYNGSKFLDQQLQTLASPDEPVVTDDASTDHTIAKIEAFAATAPFPVRLHRNAERLGYRANFMRAAGLCRSDVIAFCDQDDLWEPQKLRACLASFDDPEVLIAYHDALTVAADGTAPAVASYLQSPPMDYVLGFALIFRSSLRSCSRLWCQSLDHGEVRRWELMAHDGWFFFLGSVLGSIEHLDEPLVRYRQHGSNTFGWKARSVARCLWPSLHGRAEQYAALEMGAGRCVEIRGQLALTLAGEWRARANAGTQKYCALARLYGERQRIYGSANFRDRTGAFHRLLMSGGYRTKHHWWGLGARALLADFCLGLPAGYRLSATRARLIPRRSGA